MNEPCIGLLTGPVGVGKTTVAERVVCLARQRGLMCGGILAPAIRDSNDQKVGIWAVDVQSGEQRVLARTDCELGGPRIGPFSFDTSALAWATGTIERLLLPSEPFPCDLVIVDEVGKLELWQSTGLAPIVPLLSTGEAKRVLVIVRDSLLAELQGRLGSVEQLVFAINEESREGLPAQIVEQLLGA